MMAGELAYSDSGRGDAALQVHNPLPIGPLIYAFRTFHSLGAVQSKTGVPVGASTVSNEIFVGIKASEKRNGERRRHPIDV
jgi:hypothetical protein